jgi:PTS system ascorbate-specific IIA component
LSVGIVIVTHGHSGQSLLDDAEFILGQSLAEIRFIPFRQSRAHTTGNLEVRQALEENDSGQGVLILTDLAGASPSNLVRGLLRNHHAMMVTGVNLAMLIRVWNYRDASLESLVEKAVKGGKRGIENFSS